VERNEILSAQNVRLLRILGLTLVAHTFVKSIATALGTFRLGQYVGEHVSFKNALTPCLPDPSVARSGPRHLLVR
jgi:hypothetical protein